MYSASDVVGANFYFKYEIGTINTLIF